MNFRKIISQFIESFPIELSLIFLVLFRKISLFQALAFYILRCAYVQISSKTEVLYTHNERNEKIVSKCPNIKNANFKPHFFLFKYYMQMLTVGFMKVPDADKLTYEKQKVNNQGVNLYWTFYKGNTPSEDQPILLMMPGMTGDKDDPYVQNLVVNGCKYGFNVVIYQMRLLSEECEIPECGYFNMYDDIDAALDTIKEKYSKAKIYVCSGSYGANNLVYYLGERNTKVKKIEAAVSISNPYDMLLCSRLCEGSIIESLVTYLERNNYKKIQKGVEKCKNLKIDSEYILNCDDAKGYDENFTRIVMGFKSADEYYRAISAYNKIGNVDIPLLCLSTKDDRLTSGKAIIYDDIRFNPNIILITSDRGAHMCYISNEKLFGLKQWDIKPVFEFLKAVQDL